MVDPTTTYTLDTLVVNAGSFILGIMMMRYILGYWPFKGCFESKPRAGEVWRYMDIYYYIHSYDDGLIRYSYVLILKEWPLIYPRILSTVHYAKWLHFCYDRSKFASNLDEFVKKHPKTNL